MIYAEVHVNKKGFQYDTYEADLQIGAFKNTLIIEIKISFLWVEKNAITKTLSVATERT
jgi:hypothetical protein